MILVPCPPCRQAVFSKSAFDAEGLRVGLRVVTWRSLSFLAGLGGAC